LDDLVPLPGRFIPEFTPASTSLVPVQRGPGALMTTLVVASASNICETAAVPLQSMQTIVPSRFSSGRPQLMQVGGLFTSAPVFRGSKD
jgi:hypothetical protein